MKLVNATHGLDSVPAEPAKRKWYRHYKFPLLPMFQYSPRNKWNEPNFVFSWLMLRVHSAMSPGLGLSFDVDENGIRLMFRLPYLHIGIVLLPFPDVIHEWSYLYLWRCPKEVNED